MKNLFYNQIFFLLILIFIFSIILNCSGTEFQTVLYNADYYSDSKYEVLIRVETNPDIAQDETGRPGRNFYMDKYEYPNHPKITAENDAGKLPMINVSWYEAKDLCNSHGKRLCSIYEWRETCYADPANHGSRKTDNNPSYLYPYSSDYNTDKCVTETSSAGIVGSRSECIQSVGQGGIGSETLNSIYDLSGNVWEWVNHDFYGQADQFEGQQAIVGGYYFNGRSATCGLNIITSSNTSNEKIGFRCCRDE